MHRHRNGIFYIARDRQSQTKPADLHRLESELTACKAENLGIKKQLSECNHRSRSKQLQIDRLESENEKLENSNERCSSTVAPTTTTKAAKDAVLLLNTRKSSNVPMVIDFDGKIN